MPYAFYYDVPANEQIYRQVKAELGDARPEGLLLQLVVKREDGLRHINVWESRQQWERFQEERIAPAVGKVLAAAGMTERPPRPEVREMQLVDFGS